MTLLTIQPNATVATWRREAAPPAPAEERLANAELDPLRASDLRAAKIITIVMNSIFLAALILYGSIALAVALGGQP